MITFIIPLRHPASSKNWQNVVARLTETLTSAANACREGNARCILVANEEATLPPLPSAVDLLRVAIPPPAVSVFRGEADDNERRRAVWLDKGLKVAAGAIRARAAGSRYVMSVDADDLVSNRIPSFVAQHAGEPGWYVRTGWLLPVGGRIGALLPDFHNWCGTYAIVRTDLLPLADRLETMDPETVRLWFGHHRELIPALASHESPLAPLPFPGAIYRIGHGDGNFQRQSLASELFGWRRWRENPRAFVRQLTRLRWFGPGCTREFVGTCQKRRVRASVQG